MYWIILGILLIFMFICFIIDFCRKDILFSIIGAIVFVMALLIGAGCLIPTHIDVESINEQIEIVETANQELEDEISLSVSTYIEYEGKELSVLKPDISSADFIAFAESYPELKSSQLIQEQITTYKENKTEIVNLKKDRAQKQAAMKFWLLKKYS